MLLLVIAAGAALISIGTTEVRSLGEQACGLEDDLDIVQQGVHGSRSGEIVLATTRGVLLDPRGSSGGPAGLDPAVASVPLVFYGPDRIDERGPIGDAGTHADVAPTIASFLKGSIGADGTPLPEVGTIDARSLRRPSPRLVVTVVWQGGGWNVLEQWPGDWPNLLRLLEGGVAYEGSAGTFALGPEVAAATLATGRWPATHGVTDELVRDEGGAIERDPDPLVDGLHARWQRQQADALVGSLPAGTAADAMADGGWGDDPVPDLLTVVDDEIAVAVEGHGVDSEETNAAVIASDERLGRLLDVTGEVAGRGGYVVVLTADGGRPLDPEDVPSIVVDGARVRALIENEFGPVVEAITPTQVFLLRDPAVGSSPTDIAGFLAGLKVADVVDERVAGEVGDRYLFALASPREQVGGLRCRASVE